MAIIQGRRRGEGEERGGRIVVRPELVFYEHALFWAEPGKEIEITTNE